MKDCRAKALVARFDERQLETALGRVRTKVRENLDLPGFEAWSKRQRRRNLF